MPMFNVQKPRQFHYQPRFYDPEKEKWENLKKRHAFQKEMQESQNVDKSEENVEQDNVDAELAYFEQRVRESYSRNRRSGKLAKRAQSRNNSKESDSDNEQADARRDRIRIKRRFDNSKDDYLQPVPARKIMLYTLIIVLLLYWILF